MSNKLSSLMSKFKHTNMARILVMGQRFLYDDQNDKVSFVCAVPMQKKDQCSALTRMGREKMTLIMAHELLTQEEAEELLKDSQLERFREAVHREKLCFVRFSIFWSLGGSKSHRLGPVPSSVLLESSLFLIEHMVFHIFSVGGPKSLILGPTLNSQQVVISQFCL